MAAEKQKEIERVELRAMEMRGIEAAVEEPSSFGMGYVIGFIVFIGFAVYVLAFRPSLLKGIGFDDRLRSKSYL